MIRWTRRAAFNPFVSFALTWAYVLWPMKGSAQSPADPFTGDVRIAQPRTIQAYGVSFRNLLADLGKNTGVRFFISPSHAEDKVVVLAQNRPLGQTLRALADFYGLRWTRTGAKEFSYTLSQPAESASAEAKAILAPYESVAVALRDEAQTAADLIKLSDTERTELARRISGKVGAALATSEPEDVRKLILIHSWSQDGLLPLEQLVANLSSVELQEILRDGAAFELPAAPGKRAIPKPVFDSICALLRKSAGFTADDEINFASIRLTPINASLPRLECTISAGMRYASSLAARHYALRLPVVEPSLVIRKEDRRSEPQWQAVPNLMKAISLPSDKRQETDPPPFLALPPLAQATLKLASVARVDLIADAFWSTPPPIIDGSATVGEALSRMASSSGHEWWIKDDFVFLRGAYFAADRKAEPPSADIERWVDLAKRDQMTLDDLGEIASLPGKQLFTAVQLLEQCGMRPWAACIYQAQPHLAFWNLLSRSQRKAAQSGLRFTELSPKQQLACREALAERDRLRGGSNPSQSVTMTDTDRLTFRIEVRDTTMFRIVRPEGITNLYASSRDEALEIARRRSPNARLTDIIPMTSSYVQFLYSNARRYAARGSLNLPPRRDDDAP